MQFIDLKAEVHIIVVRWYGAVEYFHSLHVSTCHGRWRCLVPTGGILDAIVCFCKSFAVDCTSDDAAIWIAYGEI